MKKGKMAWEYLAAIILILVIIVIMLLFSNFIKILIIEKWHDFIEHVKNLIGA